MPSRHIPFSNLSSREWQNLGIVAILVFYLIRIIAEILYKNTFMILGGDFLSFWSAGFLANKQGYSSVYDLSQIGKIELLYIPKPANAISYTFIPLPTIFLPYFLIPFQILAYIPIRVSFVVWTGLNLFGYIAYLYWFSKSLTTKLSFRTLLLLVLFFPTYQSLFWGQIGIFLIIPTGEFYRSILLNKPFRAGIWLSLLLIKPQILFLIIPYLLITRQFKTILGFILPSFLILIISWLLAGESGMLAWLSLLKDVSANKVTSIGAMGMLNWRMVGLNIDEIFQTSFGSMISTLGILATIIALYFILRQIPEASDSKRYLAIFSATALVAPHFHIHSAIILVPLLFAYTEGQKNQSNLINYWAFYPPLIIFLCDLLVLGCKAFEVTNVHIPIGLFHGLTAFILSIITLYHCIETKKITVLDRIKAII
jgi:hypothetical protein